MSIASRIQAIETHLGNAYDAIVRKGVVLNILPQGYTQVDYIESSGTQYIDTLLNLSATLDIDVEFEIVQASIWQRIFGLINTGNVFQLQTNAGSATDWRLNYNSTNYDISNITELGKKVNFKFVSGEGLYVNNVLKQPIQATTSSPNGTIGLFKGYDRYSYIKIYSCKIYDNNVLIRDYIPCYRNSDNEVGMYDLVNDVFYTNQGTGNFTYGSISPEVINKNIENLSSTIDQIPNDEWQPQPDWWDIDTILAEDTENYTGKVIILIPDYAPTSIIQTGPFVTSPSMVKTSDGTTYNNVTSNITHTWDATKDKSCSLGYKTRYVILYYNSSTMNFANSQDNYVLWRNALYIIINGITISSMANGFVFTNSKLLECLKITNGLLKPSNLTLRGTLRLKKIIGLDTSLVTDMTNFCYLNGLVSYNDFWKDYQIDTSKVTNFYGAFNTSGLSYIPSLDFNSATNINNMFNTSTIITINEIKNIKISGLNISQSTEMNHDTLIRFLNALYDYSESGNTYTLTLGNTNLAKLTAEEIAIGTNKGWTIN